MTTVGRPKIENVLALPKEWFSLDNYAALGLFNTARQWHEQLALRIDLKALIRGTFALQTSLQQYPANAVNQDRQIVAQTLGALLEDLFALIKDMPVIPYELLAEKIVPIIFSRSNSLTRIQFANKMEDYPYDLSRIFMCSIEAMDSSLSSGSVRQMTPLDCEEAIALLRGSERQIMGSFIEEMNSVLPSPPRASQEASVVGNATIGREAEHYRIRRRMLLDNYRHALDFLKRKISTLPGENGETVQRHCSFHEFMDRPLPDSLMLNDRAYFVVDMFAPVEQAELEFKRLFQKLKKKGEKSKTDINVNVFQNWFRMGILPYIDLALFELYEQNKQRNEKLRIPRKQLEVAIFGCQDTRFERLPDEAFQLSDPDSKQYRALVSAAQREGAKFLRHPSKTKIRATKK